MANAKGRSIDKTHLSIDLAEERGIIHRDYIAHCLRWSHVVKHLYKCNRYKTATVLDVGCGKELPLMKMLYSNKLIPAWYIGVDVNKLSLPEMLDKDRLDDIVKLYGKTDFAEKASLNDSGFLHMLDYNHCWEIFPAPTVVTCFEVLEHVEPEHTVRILKKIREVMHNDGYAFISTPCYNGSAAANHVNEITYEALGTLIQELGFGIEGVYGTFASQKDIEPVIKGSFFNTIYQALKSYYDSNVLSNIFAPIYPEYSRNCLWVLTADPKEEQDWNVFPKWEELKQPWTSSKLWEELKP